MGQGSRYNGRTVNAKSLDFFDAVFLMPSGAGNLTDQQKADLLAFIRDDGKGILVGHAATVGYYEWPGFHAHSSGVKPCFSISPMIVYIMPAVGSGQM